jgi:hypothetical protein
VVQAALEPILEADFKPCSYGFRPGHRVQDAIAEIHFFTSRSYEWIVEGDITACFDEISHVGVQDDPATSNLLQTETVQLRTSSRSASGWPSMPAGTVVGYTDFVSRGVVDSITQLPGGRRLPLTPADGTR